jgi:hypothetical protein
MVQRASAIASSKPWVGDIFTTFVARVCRSPVWIAATVIFVFATAFFLHFWLTARSELASIKNDGQQVSSFSQQTEVMKKLDADVSSAWDSVNVALYAYDSLDAARLNAPDYAPQVRAAFRLGRVANWRVDDALARVKAADLSDPTIGRFRALDGRELLNFKDDLSVRQALLVAEMSHDPAAITQAHKDFSRQLKSSARTEFEVSVAQGHLSADLATEEAENKTALASVGHRLERLLIAFLIWIACVVFAACYLVAIRIGLIRSAREVFEIV